MEYTPALAPAFADSSYELLHLLYESVREGERRHDFLAELSRHLDMDVIQIHLYRLDKGSVLSFSSRSDAPLFEPESFPSALPATAGVRHALPDGDLFFHRAEDRLLHIIWNHPSSLLHLVARPRNSVDLEELGPRHGELLAYILPHFSSVCGLFMKQQAQLPRLNAIRKIHAILPLPLVICRLNDGLLVPNPCALTMLAKAEAGLAAGGKQLALQSDAWQLCGGGRSLRLTRDGVQVQLPAISLHALSLGSGLHYEVYLLSGPARGHIAEALLQDTFGLSAGEAQICVRALTGKNPNEMAADLVLSINTVKARLKSIYKRFRVNSVAQLAVRLYFHPAYWAAQSQEEPGRLGVG